MQLNLEAFRQILPNLAAETARLDYLNNVDNTPRIAVFGKFNHGKSTLLNALVGEDIFAASDKRETVVNKEYADPHAQVVWLDTPGLDADITGADDQKANEGAMIAADIILLVHNIKAGELDKYETEHFNQLLANTTDETKKLLVISQIDQVEEAQLTAAVAKIQQQFPQFELHCVSATRYRDHKDNARAAEKSGVPALMARIAELTQAVAKNRETFKTAMHSLLQQQLREKIAHIDQQMQALSETYQREKTQFVADVQQLFSRVAQF